MLVTADKLKLKSGLVFILDRKGLNNAHPSAENLITLVRKHHDGTTCHMNLWQKVSVSVKTELP